MRRFRRVRRAYRRLRKRAPKFRRRFRRRRGTLACKLTRMDTVDVVTTDNHSYWLHFNPNIFPEYQALAPNFEYCKFTKVVVRVMPLQNVTLLKTNDTAAVTVNQCPAYVMVPWKDQPTLTAKGFNAICSVDKAKVYKGTQNGRQTYVPAVSATTRGSNITADVHEKIEYRPIIRHLSPSQNSPMIFVGLIMFQGFADLNTTTHYNVKMDVYCKFYNQSTINV